MIRRLQSRQQETVVSVTPVPVERDSRTYKQAASLARAGLRSIVVEGEPSALPRDQLPFELISVDTGWPSEKLEDASPHGTDTESAVQNNASRTPSGQNDATRALKEHEPEVAVSEPPPDLLRRIWRPLRRRTLRAYWETRHRLQMWLAHDVRLWLRARTSALRLHFAHNVRAYRALPDADLYIVHAFPLYPAVFARSLRARAPIVYEAHDAYFDIDRPQRPTWEQRTWGLIERFCVHRARGFLTVSEGVADVLERRHGRRPSVIRNCHDHRLDEPAQSDLRRQLNLEDDAFLLVSLGNYKKGLNVEGALRALTKLPEGVHLAFVGRRHAESRKLVERLGLERRVHLVGPAPPTEVASFVASVDATMVLYRAISPNYKYALPNGFFQGIAAGKPILYSVELPEVASLAERYELGIAIDPNDPSSIAAAISRLKEDRELAQRLGDNAERAAQTESWQREEVRWARVLESASDGRVTRHLISGWVREL